MSRERVAVAAVLVLLTPSLAAQQFARAGREAMPRTGPPSGARSSLVDLDGDGALDVFFAGDRWYRNDGRGRFTAVPLAPAPAGVLQQAVGDFDGDGDRDVLVHGAVLENRAGGTSYTLRVGGRALPNALALPWLGARAQVPLPGLGTLGVDPTTAVPLTPVALVGEMAATTFAIPANAALAGMPVALQAVLFDGVRLHLTPVEHEIVRS
jgi:hypothetical protein